MPEPVTPERPAPRPAIQHPANKLDLATVSGLLIAVAGIMGGLLLESGSVQDVTQATAAMIVFGGTFGAVLVTTPLAILKRAFQALQNVLFTPGAAPERIVDELIQYSTQARKSGIITLEPVAEAIPDPFLRKALNLAVDGADLQELRKIMEIDLAMEEQTADENAKVWESAGGYSPTVGIIGAVMGLIQVMKHLEEIKEVGHGIAVAFVATLYGVAAANLLFLPCAAKLRARSRQSVLMKEMMLEGVTGIAQGLNPTMIRMKLESYHRVGEKPKRAAKPPAAPAKAAEMKTAAVSG